MADGSKRVFFVNNLADPIYLDVLARRADVRLDKLTNDSAEEAAAPVLAGAHAYQIGSSRQELSPRFHADRNLLRRTQSLLIVSTNGAGYDTVNVDDCTDAGVLVVNQTGGNKEAVAEHVLAMMLALSKRIIEADRALRREESSSVTSSSATMRPARPSGLSASAMSEAGVAQLCRGLFHMNVLAYDPYLTKDEIAARGAEKVELPDLLRRADVVSVHCPLSDETRGMIGAPQFALMQPHAYFITAARGFIHDEMALADAIRSKKIAGAGLDVWARSRRRRTIRCCNSTMCWRARIRRG